MKSVFILLGLACGSAVAQTHRVDAQKPVTRAIAVYEWTGELAKPTAARLVPVSLFAEGELKDAGTYYARPIPLALLTGNIYALESAGVPQGNVTLQYARHLQSATGAADTTVDLGWFGYGVYAAPAAAKKAAVLVASKSQPVIVSSKDPDGKAVGDTPAAGETKGSETKGTDAKSERPHFSKKPASDADATPAPASDPDRPRLSKAPAADTTGTVAGDVDGGAAAKPESGRKTDTESTTPPQDDTDRPTLRHRDPVQAAADRKAREKARDRGSVSGVGDLNADPNRPVIRRGVPEGGGVAPAQLTGLPGTLHQSVAVSDASTREPHPFRREWESSGEESATRAEMSLLAQGFVGTYAQANQLHLNASAGVGGPQLLHKNGASKPARSGRPAMMPMTFAKQRVDAFTLSYGGLPTFLYTAEVEATSTSPQAATVFVTVVAQREPSGELQVALSSVTDSHHLDRVARMQFIDAVDPDDSNRASLLFELRGQTGRQFALYRILAARADQIFATSAND